MTSDRDPLRFFYFVLRSGDLAFASRLARMLDTQLQALPRDPRAMAGGAVGVLASLVGQLRLDTA